MQVMQFDTAVLPPERRLAMFQAGAVDFDLSAIGDPLDFTARWRLLKLGDVNAIRACVSPLTYRRDLARIRADGEDRIALHFYEVGSGEGLLDGRPTLARPGQAAVWDLARPLEMRAAAPIEVSIITMPRYLLDEVLPATSPAGVVGPSVELDLAVGQLYYLFDHAADLPEESAAFYGRALRSLFAAAMLPDREAVVEAENGSAPLLQRICAFLDHARGVAVSQPAIADALVVPLPLVEETVRRFGGLELLLERRRLLAAYRLLSDPGEVAPVKDIARRCGFTSVTRFSRQFRSVFQISASDMRRRRYGHLPRWAGAYHVEQHYAALRKA